MPRISRAVIGEMVAHAREELPNEACGMVHAKRVGAGLARLWIRRDVVLGRRPQLEPTRLTVHRVKNDAASPYRYEMNPLQMMRLEGRRDREGETLFAIYHSHVASPARPSPTDVRMAFFPPGELDNEPAYPGTLYILVSLASEPPDVRAFWIRRGGEVVEEPIEVT